MTDATTTARYACVAIVCENCNDPIDPAETLMGVCRDRWACDRRRAAHTSAPPPPTRTVGEITNAERCRRTRERRKQDPDFLARERARINALRARQRREVPPPPPAPPPAQEAPEPTPTPEVAAAPAWGFLGAWETGNAARIRRRELRRAERRARGVA